jgi:hypothetical protein
MGFRGRKRVEEEFTLDRMWERRASVYCSVLGGDSIADLLEPPAQRAV